MSNKIDKKIVSFTVKDAKAEEAAAAAAAASALPAGPVEPTYVQMNEKLERPEILVGSTYKIKPGGMEHAMYVTINDIVLNQDTEQEQHRPFEIFINSKNMEQFQWVVALTRIMSAVFRKGGDVTFLVEEMKAVFDPKGGYWKPGTGIYVPSVIAEIGMVVETHLQKIGLLQKEGLTDAQKELIATKRRQAEANENKSAANDEAGGSFPANATQCAKCHQKSVIVMDGCQTCLNCGASKCG